MRRALSSAIVAGLLVAAAGCDPTPPEMHSERDDFRLEVPGLTIPDANAWFASWERPYLVLAGTRMCPALRCNQCPEGEHCDDAPLTVSGPMQDEGDGCYLASEPGDVVWTAGPPCGAIGQPPDEVHMRVVAADALETWVEYDPDTAVREAAAAEPPEATLVGDPWLGDVAWPLRIVAGTQVALPMWLRERASGHGVAWQTEAGDVQWTTTRGRAPITYPGRGLSLVGFAGGEVEAALQVADQSWPIGQIVAVDAGEATSLELAGVLIHGDASESLFERETVPLFARAIARDGEGRPLAGLPITWSVEKGELALEPQGVSPAVSELVWLEDACVPPEKRGGSREVVLRASHGELSATLTLRWTGTAGPFDSEWEPSPNCLSPAGCGCRTSEPPAAGLLLLGLLALGRRRRRDVSRDMSVGTYDTAASARDRGVSQNMFVGTYAPALARRRGVSRAMSVGACLLVLPAAGCDEDDPPAVRAESVAELGPLPARSPGNARSLALGERVLWLFADDDGSEYAISDDLDAGDGVYPVDPIADEEGRPRALLRLTADEEQFNDDNRYCPEVDPCPRLSIRTGPVVHDPDRERLLVFYSKLRREAGGERHTHLGSSIAVWRDDLQGNAVRPEVREGASEPTLMFGAGGPRLAAAALVEDNNVYAFTCDGERNPCILGRAPLARALQPDSWEFYGDGDLWSPGPAGAAHLFDGAPSMSVGHSAHAGAYLAVFAAPGSTRIVVRTAPRLEGPWSDAGEVHRVWRATPDTRIGGAVIHPDFTREGGAVDYLTYAFGESAQLVEIRWE